MSFLFDMLHGCTTAGRETACDPRVGVVHPIWWFDAQDSRRPLNVRVGTTSYWLYIRRHCTAASAAWGQR